MNEQILWAIFFTCIMTAFALYLKDRRPKAVAKERVVTFISEGQDITLDLELIQYIDIIVKTEGMVVMQYHFQIYLTNGKTVRITIKDSYQLAIDARRRVEDTWKAYRNI